MKLDNSLELWSDAHVFYDTYLHPRLLDKESKIASEEILWRTKLLSSPNGSLLSDNSMFSDIKSNKTYLLHATTKLNDIKSTGFLHSSAGCLVGSIYCTPLHKNQDGSLRIHNLARYIIKEESLRSIKARGDNAKLELVIIEISKDINASNNLAGIDYLRLGLIHYLIYDDLKYLLSRRESFDLEGVIATRIKHSIEILSMATRLFRGEMRVSTEDFFRCLTENINNLPILGYIFFEALSEYLTLYPKHKNYNEAKQIGEIYNWGYKEFTFRTYKNLLQNFNLGKFKPSIEDLRMGINQLEKDNVLSIDNIDHLLNYVKERTTFLIVSRLFESDGSNINWYNLGWIFNELSKTGLRPLLGHLIHRELRSFNRYQDFYFYFDQFKALQIWNYWNHMHIVTPFNGVIPKGEIGINPAYPDLNYKIYEGIYIDRTDDLVIGKMLDIQITPRLVNLKNTFMRTRTENNLND